MIPLMTQFEIILFKSFFGKCKNYFEFGCGGTTVLISSIPDINIIRSVDGNNDWINKVKMNMVHPVDFIHIDINGGGWGYPKDKSLYTNWPLYSSSIEKYKDKYDLVLIDGRFRVACALRSYRYVKNDGFLLVHDYTIRPQYHCIENFYTRICSVETLSVFTKNDSIDIELLNDLIHKYETIPE